MAFGAGERAPGSPGALSDRERKERAVRVEDDACPSHTSPGEKVRTFPTTPGLYLMKDAQGRVLYIGKAKNLRARAGSYFQRGSADDRRIADWIGEVVDVDFLAADSEVD